MSHSGHNLDLQGREHASTTILSINSEEPEATQIELNAVRARELELKRSRGEIACAECRRYLNSQSYIVEQDSYPF